VLSVHSGHAVSYLTDQVAAGRESYYTGAVDAGEPPGRWSGAGADALGLAGDVDADQMKMIYHHLIDPRDPHSGSPATWGLAETLGAPHKQFRSAQDIYEASLAAQPHATPERRAELRAQAERSARTAVAFIDCTYNAPKSVSVLGVAYERAASEARQRGDHAAAQQWQAKATAVEDAVRAGSAAAMAYLQETAGTARVGHHGGGAGRWADGGGWVIASFLQHDSRDHDPHAHVHNGVLNRQLCPDGTWRALDTMAIRREKPAASVIGDRVCLARLAEALGAVSATRPDGRAREVVGVGERLREQFSKRTRAITPKAAELVAAFTAHRGRAPSPAEQFKIMRRAVLATRAAKSHTGQTRDAWLDRLAAEAAAETRGGLGEVIAGVARAAEQRAHPPAWSPTEVGERAIGLAAERKAAWTRADLLRCVDEVLPDDLGVPAAEVPELLGRLADRALAGAVRLSPEEATDGLPAHLRRADGASVYDSGTVYFAAPWQLAAERAVARRAEAGGVEAFTAAEADEVVARAAAGGRQLGADQAAAVSGVLTSGRATDVLAAPAGAGKSYVVGVLAGAWTDQTVAPHAGGPRRVFGLATSQNAAEVLAGEGLSGEGLSATANTAAWRAAQARLDAAGTHADAADAALRLRRNDLVVVDEAAMVDTAALADITERCERAGAKLLLTGDARQLAAVGAGGVFADLAGNGRTFELTDVRRFTHGWEAAASLRLREGDAGVVADYAKDGRVVDGGTAEQAETRASRAWLADHLNGRDTVLVAATNEAVARLNAALRAELVRLGRVGEHGVTLGRTEGAAWAGEVAGVGDLVQARRNGRSLGAFAGHPDPPVNRDRYRVLAVGDDGGLEAARVLGRDADGGERLAEPTTLPAGYVGEHVSLGYAATAHAVQGRTVDTSHVVVGNGGDPAGVYVGLSRGRDANHAYCVTAPLAADAAAGEAHEVPRRTAAAVLADAITRDDDRDGDEGASATATRHRETERAASVATQLDRLSVELAEATAGRTGRTLDRLAGGGAISPEQRAALAADPEAMGQLDRLLRSVELAGHDAGQVLADAVSAYPLDGAHHPAGAIYSRIARDGALDLQPRMESYAGMVPAGLDEQSSARLTGLADAADDRRRELGTRAAADPPSWATAALGPVPHDAFEAHDWEHRAGWAMAYRELAGWDDERVPLGPAPGAGLAEQRAAFRLAHAALDLPDERAEEAEMSTGRLLNRYRAGQRERNWLPARVAEQLEVTALERDHRGQDATLYREHAKVADDAATASSLRADADAAGTEVDELAAVHEQLNEGVDRVRGECLAEVAVTVDLGERSGGELRRRGLDPDADRADRTSSEEWLDADRRARAEDDAHRAVHEVDVTDEHEQEHARADAHEDDGTVLETARPDIRERVERDPSEDTDPAELHRVATADDAATQLARAGDAARELAERRDVEAAEAAEDARLDQERQWHDDDQAAYEAEVQAAQDDDAMVWER